MEPEHTADKAASLDFRSKLAFFNSQTKANEVMEPDDTADKAASQNVRSKIAFFKSHITSDEPSKPDKESLRRGPQRLPSPPASQQVTTSNQASTTNYTREDEERQQILQDTNPQSTEHKSEERSGWSPKDMDIFKRPMCLIRIDKMNDLTISTETVSQLEMIDWPMLVISVVGLYRTGKSYLMNRLAGSTSGFALGDTIESTTKGIWAWCKIHPEKTKTVLLLLDTEGIGDVDKGDSNHNNKIFTLATLLCNCLVYNMKGAFDQDAVNKLTFVTKLASNIRYRGESSEDNQKLNLILPDFVLCLQDFSLKVVKDGRKVTDDDYLESSLEERKDKAEHFNKPRQCIKKYFTQRKCFTFPVPVDVDVCENHETLKSDQLSNKFKESTRRFISYIYDKNPKELVVSKPVNGLMFATLATNYVSAIRNGAVPDADDAFLAVAKKENAKVQKEATEIFKSQLGTIVLPVAASKLEQCYTNAQQKALNYLRTNVVLDNDGTFENDAQVNMDNIWNRLKDGNLKKIKELCESQLQDKYCKSLKGRIERKVFEVAGGYRKFQRDMEILKEEYFSALHDFEDHEVLWAWLSFVKITQGIELNIIQADEALSQKEKKEGKKRNEENIQKIIEQQKKANGKAIEQQKRKIEAHYKQIVQGRIKVIESETKKYAALVQQKLSIETAQRELARLQREQENRISQLLDARVSNASRNDYMEVETQTIEHLAEETKAKATTQRELAQVQRERTIVKSTCLLEDEFSLKGKTHQMNGSSFDDSADSWKKLNSEDDFQKNSENDNIDPKEARHDKDENPKAYVHTDNEKSNNARQAAEQHELFTKTLISESACDVDVAKMEGMEGEHSIAEIYSRQTKQLKNGFVSTDPSNDSDSGDDKHGSDERPNIDRKERKDNILGNSPFHKIDKHLWRRCIDSKDDKEANRLVNERIIPDQDLLDLAADRFGKSSITVQKICNSVCCYIKKNFNGIDLVYPAIDCSQTSTRKQITFIILTAQPSVIDINGYRCYPRCLQKKTSSVQDENTVVRDFEGVCQKDLSETEKIREILNQHSQSLMENHTNITSISISWIKSKGYGTENHSMEQKSCIAVYVQVKGYYPINEDILPSSIDGIDVDIREGLVFSYGGPNEHHEHLKMGCAIHGSLRNEDGNLLGGTLGGFFEADSQLYCISCAHVFFSSQDMEKLKNNGPYDLGNDIRKFQARQPVLDGSQAFGEGVRAVYKVGGNGETGVDAVMMKIDRRLPISGEFPECPHKRNPGKERPTFLTGNMYNRERVNRLVRSKLLTVVKFGCSSGWTRGSFRFDRGSVRLSHLVAPHSHTGILLYNQFEIESIGNISFAEDGDSGALVFTDENDQLSVIGIVEGGMSGTVYVTPIFEVFLALGLPGVQKMKEFSSMQNQYIPNNSVDQLSSHNLPSRSDYGEPTSWENQLHSLEEKVESIEQGITQEIARHAAELKCTMHTSITQVMSPVHGGLNTLRSDMSGLKSDVGKATSEIASAKKELKNEVQKMIQNQTEMYNDIRSLLSQTSTPNTTDHSLSQSSRPDPSDSDHTHNPS